MTTTDQWPTPDKYVLAMQDPRTVFSDSALRATVIRSTGGLPDSVQGQNAVVFFGEHKGDQLVIRCLKRPPRAGTAERYATLGTYLKKNPIPAFAAATWVQRGVLAGDVWRPVVRMEDVGGVSLRRYVEDHLHEPDRLHALAESWIELLDKLAHRRVAHGDLQQDNIRVADGGRIRLIDYDSVWAPPIAHLPPDEVGQPNFQHPGRIDNAHWGPTVDLFSAVVVHLSLIAVAADPGLWDAHHDGENLVLTAADFRSSMGTPVWYRLAGSRDIRVREVLAVLNQLCCQPAGAEFNAAAVLRDRALPGQPMPEIVASGAGTVVWWPTPVVGTPDRVSVFDPVALTGTEAPTPAVPSVVPPAVTPTVPRTPAIQVPAVVTPRKRRPAVVALAVVVPLSLAILALVLFLMGSK